MNKEFIRNFSIISHIDHGKSTLADRMLEATETVAKDKMQAQFLDMMDLERERGITIKMQPVKMNYRYQNKDYVLNMIDTPGHVDFSYEVSRSLEAVEGVVLLIDASKGIQAQTLANLELVQKQNLTVIAVINKIDLFNAREQEVAEEVSSLLNIDQSSILRISAKENINVDKVLEEIIVRIAPPSSEDKGPLKALIFDSKYDAFKGVIAQVRIKQGSIRKKDRIYLMATKSRGEAKEIGIFVPHPIVVDLLESGEIGYIATGIKEADKIRVGDTITKIETMDIDPLPGYKQLKPVVFVSFYPEVSDGFVILKEALEKIKLTDPALVFDPEFKEVLGRGFRCGFLGSLHSEIISERLKREFNLDLVISSPSVAFKVMTTQNQTLSILSPSDWPDPSLIKEALEPWVRIETMTPNIYLGGVMDTLNNLEGRYKDSEYFKSDKTLVIYEAPLRKIIVGFHDRIKSVSQGYASFNYNLIGFEKGDLVKLEFMIAGETEEVFSRIVSRKESLSEGRKTVEKLKEFLPVQQFSVSLQAKIYGKIIARETIKARRRDVTGALYGGDVTRKNKLLDKQKKGKKKMAAKGKIRVPSDVYFKIFKD
jgi:GTP-binding protein LepA